MKKIKELKLTTIQKNNIRVKKFIEAERLIAFSEYNQNKKWWDVKAFDYDVFFSGFMAGMNYSKRCSVYEKEEDKEEEK